MRKEKAAGPEHKPVQVAEKSGPTGNPALTLELQALGFYIGQLYLYNFQLMFNFFSFFTVTFLICKMEVASLFCSKMRFT